jgi:hypothetical protein
MQKAANPTKAESEERDNLFSLLDCFGNPSASLRIASQ